jgi:pimeloyl-ACP methyl ester carboxylesterase
MSSLLHKREAYRGVTTWIIDTPDDARLAVDLHRPRTESSGFVILLIHGWAASQRVWDSVRDLLLHDGHEVVSYDLRGHGRSILGREPPTLDRLAADLGLVVASLGDRLNDRQEIEGAGSPQLIAVGHSGGGYLLTKLCATDSAESDSVAGAVFVSSAAQAPESSAIEERLMGSEVFTSVLRRSVTGDAVLAHTMGATANAGTQRLVRELFASTAPVVRRCVFACSGGADLRKEVDQITVPSVVVSGRKDAVVKTWRSRDLALRLADGRFVALDDVGHMVPVESPGAVRSAVADVARRAQRRRPTL